MILGVAAFGSSIWMTMFSKSSIVLGQLLEVQRMGFMDVEVVSTYGGDPRQCCHRQAGPLAYTMCT